MLVSTFHFTNEKKKIYGSNRTTPKCIFREFHNEEVSMKGLEPSWIAPLEPKPSAYTNSATSTGHYTYPYACCGALNPTY